jgi:hypothetical protein
MRLVLVAMLVACGSSPPPPLTGTTELSHRDTPAPAIAWKDNAFAPMVPSVARAAELVVVPVHNRDGERGYPNLTIEVRDRSDKVVQTIAVLAANDYEKLAPGGVASKALTDRVAAANVELQKLHDLHDLVAMKSLEVQPAVDPGLAHLAIGDGLDVDWGGDHVHVFRHNSDRAVTNRDAKGWQELPHGTCTYPSFLASTYHVPEISVVVVELGYRGGSDACGEPNHQFHVVTW